jgi:hypothetical protein
MRFEEWEITAGGTRKYVLEARHFRSSRLLARVSDTERRRRACLLTTSKNAMDLGSRRIKPQNSSHVNSNLK